MNRVQKFLYHAIEKYEIKLHHRKVKVEKMKRCIIMLCLKYLFYNAFIEHDEALENKQHNNCRSYEKNNIREAQKFRTMEMEIVGKRKKI